MTGSKARKNFERVVDGVITVAMMVSIAVAVLYWARMVVVALEEDRLEANYATSQNDPDLHAEAPTVVLLPGIQHVPEFLAGKQDQEFEPAEKSADAPDYAQMIDPDEWQAEIAALARMAWGEARGCSTEGKAAVMWCALNRVDAGSAAGFRDSVTEVITQPGQFNGYRAGNPTTDELCALARDVLGRWIAEKSAEHSDGSVLGVGRVLPRDYLWFTGNGLGENVFRNAYRSPYAVWDWSLPSPYEEEAAA